MKWYLSAAIGVALFAAVPAGAQGPAMGPGGGAQAPPIIKPSFRDRLWERGGPQMRLSSGKLVAEVRVVGNQAVSLNTILSQVQTRKDRIFDPEVLESDVRRLASKGLFRDVDTYTQDTAEGVIVTISVVERPTIGHVKLVGNRQIADKALRREAGIKPGDPLNKFAVEDARRRISDYYKTKGYPKAQVEIFEGDRPTDEGVTFAISEGNIERILDVEFMGNTIASDARLKTQIQSKPGILWYFFRGKVDREKIDQDVDRLTRYYRSLGFFRARIGRELVYSESGKWLSLRFVIDEGPRYRVRDIRLEGVTRFDPSAIKEHLKLKPGDFFLQDKMRIDVNQLRDLYGSQGFIYADVKAESRFMEEPGQLDLVYLLEEGQQWRAGEIQVRINGEHPHTRRTVVMNRLSIRPNDIVDTRKVRGSLRRLQSSQLFETNPAIGKPPEITFGTPSLEGMSPPPETMRSQSPNRPFGAR